jgi:hypothetical protein
MIMLKRCRHESCTSGCLILVATVVRDDQSYSSSKSFAFEMIYARVGLRLLRSHKGVLSKKALSKVSAAGQTRGMAKEALSQDDFRSLLKQSAPFFISES